MTPTSILLIIAALIVLFLVVAAVQPSEFRVSRSTSIAAPASVPFGYVNDLRRWLEVSPYTKMDPAAKYTFEGATAGLGASMTWVGNGKVGAGRMTIVDVSPDEFVRMRMDFEKPFKSTCVTEFNFEPHGTETLVTWSMTGQKVFLTKAVGLIMSMDKMVGPQFAEGLANLKARSETRSS